MIFIIYVDFNLSPSHLYQILKQKDENKMAIKYLEHHLINLLEGNFMYSLI